MLSGLIKRVYFLGIGGIGMSALARYFRAMGKAVAGYDLHSTPLTSSLISEGIHVHFEDDPELIPLAFRNHPLEPETLVVFTPAIPPENREMTYFLENGYVLHKRSEILGLIANSYKTIAIAGTHGKSTVSAMVAQILVESGIGCTAFLGALSKSLNSNLVISGTSDYAVAEADEFDRSFLQLSPFMAVVTSMDPDHLDIYGDYRQLTAGFRDFLNRVRINSDILLKRDLPLTPDPARNLRVHDYSLDDTRAEFHASALTAEGMGYRFNLTAPGGLLEGLVSRVPGIINVENAVAAAAICRLAGIADEGIRKGIGAFSGLVRRFDLRFSRSGVTYIDDYAHHPNEIKALIGSIRLLFPGRKITGIFQPHLYSRTRDLAGGFAAELSRLDELILLDIYPAREKPIPGIDSRIILDGVGDIPKSLLPASDLPARLAGRHIEVLLTIGAGDIDKLTGPIVDYLNEHVA